MTTLFYSKILRVSRVRAITDTGTGDEKRTGEVPTLGTKDQNAKVYNQEEVCLPASVQLAEAYMSHNLPMEMSLL